MQHAYALAMLWTALVSLGLGVFVWLKNPKRGVNIAFGLMSLTIGWWAFFLSLAFFSGSETMAYFFSRTFHCGVIFIPITYLHMVYAFLDVPKKKLLIVGYIIAFIFFILNIFTPLFIKDKAPKLFFSYYGVPGPLYPIFLLTFFGWPMYGVCLLFKNWKKTSGLKHNQITYMIVGSLIGFIAGSSSFPLWYDIPLNPIGLFFVWLYVPILAYAIIKHRLMDIYVIIRKSIIYSVLALLVTTSYVFVVFLAQQLLGKTLGLGQWAVAFLASVVIALGFSPVKDALAALTDKIFFKKRYDYQKTIREASKAITSVIRLDDLINLLEQVLINTIKVRNFSLFIYDKKKQRMIQQLTAAQKERLTPLIIQEQSPLINALKKQRQPLILEEISHQVITKGVEEKKLKELEQIERQMKQLNIALSIPLILKGKLIGLLNLGAKLSGDAFSTTDLELLSILANQTAIALDNASVYERERELSQLKSQFVSVAAHRLRTPLSVIKWAASLLKETKCSQEQRDLIEKTFIANERMINLVNDLLDVSRIEEGKVIYNLALVRIEDVVEESLKDFKQALAQKDIRFSFKKPKEPLPKIRADIQRMKSAISTLLENAITYTNKGGRIKITLELNPKNQKEILFSIKDNGIGIPESAKPHIFEKFFRARNAIKHETEGTGLGLFIAKSIIEEHQGRIWFESKENQGTTFWVGLPVVKSMGGTQRRP